MCVVILRMSLSRILTGLRNIETDLYEEGSVEGLVGLSMGIILFFFYFSNVCDLERNCAVEYICEGPDGYRPDMFKVPVGYAIRVCGTCGFGAVFYCFGHGGEWWVRGLILSVGWWGES